MQYTLKKNIELKSAWDWIRLSFLTFREKPLHFAILGLLSTIAGIIPLIGAFISPFFIARFAQLTQKIESQEEIKFSTLFADLLANSTLVRLAFLNFSLNAILVLGQYLFTNYIIGDNLSLKVGAAIVYLFFALILQMLMWIAPIIIINDSSLKPKDAMLLSLKAGFYNIPALILYSLLIIIFSIVAIIPLGLGLLIWLPMLSISCYYIYKTIYHAL